MSVDDDDDELVQYWSKDTAMMASYPIDMPVLHCVGYIGSLKEMLDDNGRLPVDIVLDVSFIVQSLLLERFVPSGISRLFELLVNNVGCHDSC